MGRITELGPKAHPASPTSTAVRPEDAQRRDCARAASSGRFRPQIGLPTVHWHGPTVRRASKWPSAARFQVLFSLFPAPSGHESLSIQEFLARHSAGVTREHTHKKARQSPGGPLFRARQPQYTGWCFFSASITSGVSAKPAPNLAASSAARWAKASTPWL